MDCDHTKELFGPYLDDGLTPAEKEAVEQHLSSCSRCAADLEELRRTIGHLKGLEEKDAPAWLTQKIMARVREDRPRQTLLRRLFYPLHVKIPLQAVATVLIAVVTIYVFRAMRQEVPPAQTLPQQREQVVSKEKVEEPVAPGQRRPMEKQQAPAVPSPAPQDTARTKSGAAGTTETGQQPPAEDARLKEERPAPPSVQRGGERKKALSGSAGEVKQPPAAGSARNEGRTLRDSAPAPGRMPLRKAGQVLWEDAAITPDDMARVTRVVLVQEKGNELVLDVTYFLSDTFDGVATVGVFPDIPDWSVAEAPALKGMHTVSISVSRRPSEGARESANLRIEVAGYKDRSFIGPLYRRVVPFAKHWEGR